MQAPAPRVRFVVGGVQKGGTTALASFLGRCPQVVLPAGKEAHVFDAPDFDEGWDVAAVDRSPDVAPSAPACSALRARSSASALAVLTRSQTARK